MGENRYTGGVLTLTDETGAAIDLQMHGDVFDLVAVDEPPPATGEPQSFDMSFTSTMTTTHGSIAAFLYGAAGPLPEPPHLDSLWRRKLPKSWSRRKRKRVQARRWRSVSYLVSWGVVSLDGITATIYAVRDADGRVVWGEELRHPELSWVEVK